MPRLVNLVAEGGGSTAIEAAAKMAMPLELLEEAAVVSKSSMMAVARTWGSWPGRRIELKVGRVYLLLLGGTWRGIDGRLMPLDL